MHKPKLEYQELIMYDRAKTTYFEQDLHIKGDTIFNLSEYN